jgi:hypothetical protein
MVVGQGVLRAQLCSRCLQEQRAKQPWYELTNESQLLAELD